MRILLRVVSVFFALGIVLIASPVVAGDETEDGQQAAADDQATEKSDSASAAVDSDIDVIDAKAASDVEDREAVGESDEFSADDKVTIWMAVKNPDGDSQVKLVWKYNDNEVDTQEVDVGESWRWRTWARRTIQSAGDWEVEIQDEDDNTLETVAFSVSD